MLLKYGTLIIHIYVMYTSCIHFEQCSPRNAVPEAHYDDVGMVVPIDGGLKPHEESLYCIVEVIYGETA